MTLVDILKVKFNDINTSIDNISVSPIDLEDITWDNLLGTIYFYVNGTQFTMESGTTKTGIFIITESNNVLYGDAGMQIKLGNVYVKASDIIVSDGLYTVDGLSGQ